MSKQIIVHVSLSFLDTASSPLLFLVHCCHSVYGGNEKMTDRTQNNKLADGVYMLTPCG